MKTSDVIALIALIISIIFGVPPFVKMLKEVVRRKKGINIKVLGSYMLEECFYFRFAICNNTNTSLTILEVFLNGSVTNVYDMEHKPLNWEFIEVKPNNSIPLVVQLMKYTPAKPVILELNTSIGRFHYKFESYNKAIDIFIENRKEKR